MIQASDIIYVFSGGSTNNDPEASLGGEPSSVLLGSGINNLFVDISEEQAADGYIDYRCFYIFNNNYADSFFSTKLWIASETAEGSTISVGVTVQDEVQVITITGTVSSGSLTLAYDGGTFEFDYDSNITTWASNLETAINGFDVLTGVVVSATLVGSVARFECTFSGADGNRYHPLLEVDSNDLSPEPTVEISKLVNGSPINAIAVDIDVGTTPPTGIDFGEPDANDPIVIGTLKPLEGFPVWLRRTTPEDTDALVTDSVKIRFRGSPV